ncbi:hypothetical protein [Sphingomonas elodea]|uniref:hypothetical protein n=1 Tax=Sphingomonas elodea TaxID=179878 RepID=UPI001ED95CD7|nr:hypothetical protein [Sphingomonas elodea]
MQQRTVDDLKVAIGASIERIAALEQQARELTDRMREERMLAHALPFASDAWLATAKHAQTRLGAETEAERARLVALREQAREAYGTFRAIESAAERFRTEAEREAEAAEQAAIDDIAAARFLRERKRMPVKAA